MSVTRVAELCEDCGNWHSGYALPQVTPSQRAACQRCDRGEAVHAEPSTQFMALSRKVLKPCKMFVGPN